MVMQSLPWIGDHVVGFAQSALVGLAASWMALLFHEAGHVAAARLVGVRVWGIQLGMGPTVWQGRSGRCQVRIGALPFLGAIQLLDEDACAIGYRDIRAGTWRFEWGPQAWRAPIISAAGGFGNLLGLMMMVSWWASAGQPGLGSFLGDVLLFSMACNFAGYLNLLPCFRSDGIHLLAHVRAARLGPSPSPAAAA